MSRWNRAILVGALAVLSAALLVRASVADPLSQSLPAHPTSCVHLLEENAVQYVASFGGSSGSGGFYPQCYELEVARTRIVRFDLLPSTACPGHAFNLYVDGNQVIHTDKNTSRFGFHDPEGCPQGDFCTYTTPIGSGSAVLAAGTHVITLEDYPVDGSATCGMTPPLKEVLWTVNPESAYVAAKGYLAYHDTSYVPGYGSHQHPLRSVPVELWDYDGPDGANDLIGTTVTDSTGFFYFPPILNRDSDMPDQGHLDLYVRARLQSDFGAEGDSVVNVVNGVGQTWPFQSTPHSDVDNGLYDFGTVEPTGYDTTSACHIYDIIEAAHHWVITKNILPPHKHEVIVSWDKSQWNRTGYIASLHILLVSGVSDSDAPGSPDEWDDHVLSHEYGHHLMVTLFDAADTTGGGAAHSVAHQDTTRKGLPSAWQAWSEGVATFVAHITTPPWTQYNINYGATAGWTAIYSDTLDMETGIYTYTDPSGYHLGGIFDDKGYTWAASIADLLWDIADSTSESLGSCADSLSDGVDKIWDVLARHSGILSTTIDFYKQYCARYGSQHLEEVFCRHGMVASDCAGFLAVNRQLGTSGMLLLITQNPISGMRGTRIRLVGAARGDHVRVDLFDVAGRLARRIYDGPVADSPIDIVWDGHGEAGGAVPSGVYFARVTRRGDSVTRRLVVAN